MIAQSISCDPLLLVADEPTTALDVTVQAEILDLIRDLNKRLNSAVILITHDMGVVADLSDHMIVMKDGIVVESGSTKQVFNKPSHQYTKDLLAAVPHLGSADLKPVIDRTGQRPTLSLKNVNIEYPARARNKSSSSSAAPHDQTGRPNGWTHKRSRTQPHSAAHKQTR